MPETAIPPSAPEHSDQAVLARFSESVLALPEEQRGNITLSEPKGGPPPVKEVVDTPKTDEPTKTDSDIPSEFFDTPKETVDEWEKITNEDQKGHITSKDWKNYKTMTKAKMEAKEKELQDLRSKVPSEDFVPEKIAKRMEQLQKELKERDDLITRKYVQESPEYRDKFGKRETILNSQVEEIGKDAGLEQDQIESILNASRKRRFQLLEEVENGAAKADLVSTLSERDRLQKEKDLYLEDKKNENVSWQEQQEQQTDQQKAKQKELLDYAFNEVLTKMRSEYSPLKEIPGNDSWNKSVREDIQLAIDMYNGKDFTPQRDAEMFLAAATSKRLMKMLNHASDRARAAEKENAELKAAGPSASQAGTGNGSDPTKGMTPDQRAAWEFNNQVAKAGNNGFAR